MAKYKKKSARLSKRQQADLLRKQGYSYKQINRMDSGTRDKISDLIIADKKENKKQQNLQRQAREILQKSTPKTETKKPAAPPKKKPGEARAVRVSQKRMRLHELGFDSAMMKRGKYNLISDKRIDAIKQADLKSGNITREKYPFLFPDTAFDFDKIYSLKDGNRMYVAFRDFQGELDIQEILAQYGEYSNERLLDGLEAIANEPPTYQKGTKGSSSGRAGEYKFMVAKQEVIEVFNREVRKPARKKKKRKRQQYTGEKPGYQVIKNGRRNSFDEVTPRNLLIMANAIMYNVTEKDRANFYNRFYTDIVKNIPEMKDILPTPKY